MKQQLQQAQKMEVVGQLAGSVSHDFNNLLMVILVVAEDLLRDFQEDPDVVANEEVADRLKEIVKAGDSAAALTRQLLLFSRKQMPRPELLDMNRIASETVGLVARLMPEEIEFEVRIADGLGSLHADAVQIEQVIMAHLFEPFFTTKDEGKGTGMGLASAYGIITQSGGFIEVATELGRGTTFTFYLPSVSMPAASEAAPHTDESGHAESH